MMQNKKLNFTIGGAVNNSFNAAIGSSIRKLDWLANKENQLKTKQTLVSKFHADKAAMSKLTDKLRQQKANLSSLDTQYKASGGSSEALRARIDKLKKEVSNTNHKFNEQRQKTGQTRRELKKAGVDTANLTGEEKRLKNALEKTQKSMQRRAKGFQAVGSSVRFLSRGLLATTAAAAGASAAAYKLSNSFANHGDNVAKTADKLGIGTRELQRLRYAAEIAGMSTQEFDKSLSQMQKNTIDAAMGLAEPKKAMDMLGLSAMELKELKPEESMALIADKIQHVENKQERLRIATLLFGRSGVGMVNMLKNGSKEMEILGDKGERIGYVLSEKSLRGAEQNVDAFLNMSTSIKSVSFAIGNALLPTFTQTFDNITSWISKNQDKVREWAATAKTVFSAVSSFLLVTGKVVGVFFSSLWSFGEKLGGWLYDVQEFFSSFSASVVSLWDTATQAITNNSFIKGLGLVKNSVVNIFGSIKATLVQSIDFLKNKFEWLSNSIGWISDKAQSIKKWWNGEDDNKEINLNKTSTFAGMDAVATKLRENRNNQTSNKNNNVSLHNTITIQGNADKKHVEEAIKAATMPLYGRFGHGIY